MSIFIKILIVKGTVLDIKTDDVHLMFGDCLERMKEIPDGSIDMILTDPPFGTMTSIGQTDGIVQGMKGRTDWDLKLDTKRMMGECFRVLKNRGAMCLFSQGDYTNDLMKDNHGNLPFSYRMIWVKDHFGNGLIAKKAPVNLFEDINVFFKRAEDMRGHPLQQWFNDELAKTPLTIDDIIKIIGNGGVRHHFTKGKVFRIPNEQRYTELQNLTGVFSLDYSDVKSMDKMFKDACSNRDNKIFNLPDGVKHKSNVMYHPKDPMSKHPTQKPVALLEDLITTYTNKGACVLDFTFGNCSTGVAAINTGRKFTGVELNEHWFKEGSNRLLTLKS